MESVSIVIEVMAFFFVTIDLYGRDRLRKLHQRISEATGKTFESPKGFMIVSPFLFLVSGFFLWLGVSGLVDDYQSHHFINWLALIWSLFWLAEFGVFVYLWLKLIFAAFDAEGAFLVIGAILFVAAKGLLLVSLHISV